MDEIVIKGPIKKGSGDTNSDGEQLAHVGNELEIDTTYTVEIDNPSYVPPDPNVEPDPNVTPDPAAFVQPATLTKPVAIKGNAKVSSGATNVFVNGSKVARIGDPISFNLDVPVTINIPQDPNAPPPEEGADPVPTTKFVTVKITGNGEIIENGDTVKADGKLVSRKGDKGEITLQVSLDTTTPAPTPTPPLVDGNGVPVLYF